jgi:uncharacterized membrane protein
VTLTTDEEVVVVVKLTSLYSEFAGEVVVGIGFLLVLVVAKMMKKKKVTMETQTLQQCCCQKAAFLLPFPLPL